MAIYGDSVIEDTYYEYMYIISIERIYEELTSFGSVSFFGWQTCLLISQRKFL